MAVAGEVTELGAVNQTSVCFPLARCFAESTSPVF
jgi:hypothetical protein